VNFFNIAASILGAYGLFILSSGLYGYFKTGSTPSLIAGSCLAFFLFLNTLFLVLQKSWAHPVALYLLILAATLFLYRYSRNFSFWPAGLLAVLGLLALILLIIIRTVKR
jgi:uncharacterized membrane protein (UPF0136 family)